MQEKDLGEVTLAVREIYKGKVVQLQECDVRLPNGRSSVREVVRHPGAVAILVEPNANELLLVSQFRYAPDEVLLELPAGKVEPGESTMESATRELEEETGFQAQQLYPVFEFFTSPGFADERIFLYYATDLIAGETNLDEDEFVLVRSYSRDELLEKLNDGSIRDAKTLIGIQWWLQNGNHR